MFFIFVVVVVVAVVVDVVEMQADKVSLHAPTRCSLAPVARYDQLKCGAGLMRAAAAAVAVAVAVLIVVVGCLATFFRFFEENMGGTARV